MLLKVTEPRMLGKDPDSKPSCSEEIQLSRQEDSESHAPGSAQGCHRCGNAARERSWGSSTIPTGGNSRGMRFAGAWVSPPCLTAFSQKRGEQLSGRGTVSVASFGRIRSLIPRATRLPQTVQGVRVGADLDLSPRPRDMEDLSACAPGPVRGWLKL